MMDGFSSSSAFVDGLVENREGSVKGKESSTRPRNPGNELQSQALEISIVQRSTSVSYGKY